MVFEKTKGNPFFLLEFLRSLVKGHLLTYSLRKKAWTWDTDAIRAEVVTDNVLHLLEQKMTSFTEDIQLALKVLSCFGLRVDGAVVEYLSSIEEYARFRDWLDFLVNEGCVRKVGVTSAYRFVHDKVREAAYGLIPDGDKTQVRTCRVLVAELFRVRAKPVCDSSAKSAGMHSGVIPLALAKANALIRAVRRCASWSQSSHSPIRFHEFCGHELSQPYSFSCVSRSQSSITN